MSSSILFSFIEVGTFSSRCFLTTLDRIRTDFQPWKSAPVDWHTTAPHVFLCRKVDIAGLSTSMELASATCDWDRSNRDRAGGFKYECYIYTTPLFWMLQDCKYWGWNQQSWSSFSLNPDTFYSPASVSCFEATSAQVRSSNQGFLVSILVG